MKNFVIIALLISNYVLSQTPQVILVSPNFNEITPTMNPEISATFNVDMGSSTFDELSFIVFGERSGYHSGNISYIKVTKTASFSSNELFNAGERVTVQLSNQIRSSQGDALTGFSWVFRIPSGIAPVNFSEPIEYGGGGYFMQCTDMNNDNYPDIVTSSGVIWLNNGGGEFTESWYIQDVTTDQPLIVEDFNRDGNMDVFYYGFDGLKIGTGDGLGNFTFTTKPFWFRDFISADFNGDGYPDVAGLSDVTYIPPDSTTLDWSIAFNDGTGGFSDTTLFKVGSGGYPVSLIAADMENDGDIDVVIGSQPYVIPQGGFGLDGIILGRNDGNSDFNTFELYPAGGYLRVSCPSLYSSDFNNDTFTDIAVMGCFAGVVALNSGSGTFGYDSASVRQFWGAENEAPFTGGDIDGDTWIDLLVSGYEWPPDFGNPYYAVNLNNVSYWNNDFNDTLPTGQIWANAIVDVNLDTKLDLVHSGDGVYITLNKDGVSSVEGGYKESQSFYLYQNYPNPFNPTTTITYSTQKDGLVSLKVYDILGKEVASLVNEPKIAGTYNIEFNASNLASGVYFYQLRAGPFVETKKLILLN